MKGETALDKAELEERLEEFYAVTGERLYLKALRALQPEQKGRNMIRDQPHLVRMARLLFEGKASSRWEAARIVAREAEGLSELATAKRLHRKFAKEAEFYLSIAQQLRMDILSDQLREASEPARQILDQFREAAEPARQMLDQLREAVEPLRQTLQSARSLSMTTTTGTPSGRGALPIRPTPRKERRRLKK